MVLNMEQIKYIINKLNGGIMEKQDVNNENSDACLKDNVFNSLDVQHSFKDVMFIYGMTISFVCIVLVPWVVGCGTLIRWMFS